MALPAASPAHESGCGLSPAMPALTDSRAACLSRPTSALGHLLATLREAGKSRTSSLPASGSRSRPPAHSYDSLHHLQLYQLMLSPAPGGSHLHNAMQGLQRMHHGRASPAACTLDRTGSFAISRTMGGASRGVPCPSRHRQEARSKRKPSTWYSSTHLHSTFL